VDDFLKRVLAIREQEQEERIVDVHPRALTTCACGQGISETGYTQCCVCRKLKRPNEGFFAVEARVETGKCRVCNGAKSQGRMYDGLGSCTVCSTCGGREMEDHLDARARLADQGLVKPFVPSAQPPPTAVHAVDAPVDLTPEYPFGAFPPPEEKPVRTTTPRQRCATCPRGLKQRNGSNHTQCSFCRGSHYAAKAERKPPAETRGTVDNPIPQVLALHNEKAKPDSQPAAVERPVDPQSDLRRRFLMLTEGLGLDGDQLIENFMQDYVDRLKRAVDHHGSQLVISGPPLLSSVGSGG
jgi:hypothetical protein